VAGILQEKAVGHKALTSPQTSNNSSQQGDKAAKESGGKKWKFVRQKSQQMLSALSSKENHNNEDQQPLVQSQQQQSPQQPTAVASSMMMHDFNLSMSEYRSEIRDNIAHLDAKISRLESVILRLADRLPDQHGQQAAAGHDEADNVELLKTEESK